MPTVSALERQDGQKFKVILTYQVNMRPAYDSIKKKKNHQLLFSCGSHSSVKHLQDRGEVATVPEALLPQHTESKASWFGDLQEEKERQGSSDLLAS